MKNEDEKLNEQPATAATPQPAKPIEPTATAGDTAAPIDGKPKPKPKARAKPKVAAEAPPPASVPGPEAVPGVATHARVPAKAKGSPAPRPASVAGHKKGQAKPKTAKPAPARPGKPGKGKVAKAKPTKPTKGKPVQVAKPGGLLEAVCGARMGTKQAEMLAYLIEHKRQAIPRTTLVRLLYLSNDAVTIANFSTGLGGLIRALAMKKLPWQIVRKRTEKGMTIALEPKK